MTRASFSPFVGLVAAAVATGIAASPAGAQQPAATPPARQNCKGPEYRQFDYWVGEWDVSIPQGHAGTNSVTLEEDGCVVHEHWKSVMGETGQSFNFYDRNDRKWHQVWISNSGGVLDLSGGLVDGAISYTGETRGPKGRRVLHDLRFIPDSAGNVRQLWKTSLDDGTTWTVGWDGLYRRKSGS